MVIGIAYTIQKKFRLNVTSLAKVHIYAFMPSLMFYNVYFNKLSGDMLFKIVGFFTLMFFILMIMSSLFGRVLKLERSKEKAFVNSVALSNQGNYGLPLITLLFAGPMVDQAVSIQLTLILTASILINTFGLFNASSGSYSGLEALKNVFRMPLIYVIITGFLLRVFDVTLWKPIISTIELMKVGVVPMALFILGTQLAETEIKVSNPLVYVSNGFKLIISPLIAFALVKVFGIEGMLAQILILSSAFPTAVNSVVLAIEFKGDYHFASQSVLFSTLISSITVTVIIGIVMNIGL
jgi:hypothetical protein